MSPYAIAASYPSTSSSSDDDAPSCPPPVKATDLLSVAIKKRRALAATKKRDLRLELLHTGMIQSLCKHLGEGRAKSNRRRRGGKKRSSSELAECPVQAPEKEPPTKRTCIPAPEDEDPFGLDAVFIAVYGRVPTGSSTRGRVPPLSEPAESAAAASTVSPPRAVAVVA